MIGARSLAAIVVAACAWVWALRAGVATPSHLSEITPSTALIIGVFASLAGALVITLWHPEGNSVFSVGVHRGRLFAGAAANHGRRALDLPVSVQRVLYLAAFVAVGLVSFTNAAAAELKEAWTALGARGSEYCREVQLEAKKVKAPIVDQRGCALIRRAYELGYEKSLGDCAPKEGQDIAEVVSGDAPPPCEGRKLDEPLLHYGWRLLEKRASGAKGAASELSPAKNIEIFKKKLEYLDELALVPKHAILGSPHASHHIFTNLPAPRDSSWLADTLSPPRCKVEVGAPSLDWSGAREPLSALFESAVGQLVLNPRFGETAIKCDEIEIHWGVETSLCADLAERPAAVLDDHGDLESAEAVIERHRSHDGRYKLAKELAKKLGRGRVEPAPDVATLVSAACLWIGETVPLTKRTAKLSGAEFEVRELGIETLEPRGSAQLEIYQALSLVLAGSRYVGQVDDKATVALRLDAKLEPAALDGDDFPLGRLEMLTDTDPFLGDGWPLDRGDLDAVYPFESHLRPVALAFRRRFAMIRGRL